MVLKVALKREQSVSIGGIRKLSVLIFHLMEIYENMTIKERDTNSFQVYYSVKLPRRCKASKEIIDGEKKRKNG